MIDEVWNQIRMPCSCAMQIWVAYIHYFHGKTLNCALKTSERGEKRHCKRMSNIFRTTVAPDRQRHAEVLEKTGNRRLVLGSML